MEERKLTCIGCPMGCQVTISYEMNGETVDESSINVTGNTCPRGKEYAISEVTNPTRIVTGTVGISNREGKVVPVKTKTPIPKGKIMEVAKALMDIKATAPLNIGDVLSEDICGTGSQLIVTNNID